MSVAVAHSDSEEGRSALLHGAAEAVLRGTDLLVLHLLEGTEPAASGPAAEALDAGVRDALRAGGAPEVAWSVRTAAEGHDTAGALVDLLAETGAELLVMGSRRRSPVGKLLLGSTVQRVVLDAPVPVLVVKAGARPLT